MAYTDDERPVHLRFRHGRGRVEVDFQPTDYVEPYGWPSDKEGDLTRLVFEGEDGMDGYISLEDFCRLANIEMAPTLKETSPYDG